MLCGPGLGSASSLASSEICKFKCIELTLEVEESDETAFLAVQKLPPANWEAFEILFSKTIYGKCKDSVVSSNCQLLAVPCVA